jgi:hypothetical protein
LDGVLGVWEADDGVRMRGMKRKERYNQKKKQGGKKRGRNGKTPRLQLQLTPARPSTANHRLLPNFNKKNKQSNIEHQTHHVSSPLGGSFPYIL